MEIRLFGFDEAIKAEAQKETLKREMQSRIKDDIDWISFEALKIIFDLQDIVPEVKRPDDKDV